MAKDDNYDLLDADDLWDDSFEGDDSDYEDSDSDDLLFDGGEKSKESKSEENENFNLFKSNEPQTPAAKISEYPVAGVGLYSFWYKFLSVFIVFLAGAALGGASVAVCYYFDLYFFFVLKYMPVMDVGALVLFYIFFAVRGYNYKNGAADRPEKGSKVYKKMNSMYYTNCRAIIMLVLIFLFDVSIIVFSNFVYPVAL